MNIEEKIIKQLDKIKPFLWDDGGDIEFVKFDKGIAYIRLLGKCIDCPLNDITLNEGIEDIIINSIPEVIKVEQI